MLEFCNNDDAARVGGPVSTASRAAHSCLRGEVTAAAIDANMDLEIAMDLVIDSCVVISGLIIEDRLHEPAKKFFRTAAERGDLTWAPATVLWDVGSRFLRQEALEETVDDEVRIQLRPMDVTAQLFYDTQGTHLRFEGRALRIVRSSIRGPDRVFLSCALAKRAPLITWDGRVRKQAREFGVAVITPDDYIEGKDPGGTAPVPTAEEALKAFADAYHRQLARTEQSS